MALRLKFGSYLLSVFCILFLVGCSGWPGISENTQGLGQGQIATLFRYDWGFPEDFFSEKIKELLITANKSNQPRSAAESVGMTCEAPPSRSCKYFGVVRYFFINGPSGNPDADKPHYVRINVTLPDFNNPNIVIVKQDQMVIDNDDN
jgi:hypothetical protein